MRKIAAAPAIAGRDDVDATVFQRFDILQALDGAFGSARAAGIEEFAGEHLDVPIDADYADAVIADSANGARRRGCRDRCRPSDLSAIGDIDAMAVVYIAVAVVIDSVIGAFTRVIVDIGGKVGVIIIEAGIENGDYNIVAAGGNVPGGRAR